MVNFNNSTNFCEDFVYPSRNFVKYISTISSICCLFNSTKNTAIRKIVNINYWIKMELLSKILHQLDLAQNICILVLNQELYSSMLSIWKLSGIRRCFLIKIVLNRLWKIILGNRLFLDILMILFHRKLRNSLSCKVGTMSIEHKKSLTSKMIEQVLEESG